MTIEVTYETTHGYNDIVPTYVICMLCGANISTNDTIYSWAGVPLGGPVNQIAPRDLHTAFHQRLGL